MIRADVPLGDYVADRVGEGPSLSSSLAHVLLSRSPAHCRHLHPRLNPSWQPDDDRDFDLGTAAHAVLLEGRELFVIDYPDFRTKHAQALRDEAKAAGKLPVLTHQASDIASMVTIATTKFALCPDLEGYNVADLLPERTITWEQDGVALRCRPDWMSQDFKLVISYKTCRTSAEPNAFLRTILGSGYDLQAAFELAGVKAATGVDAHYVWLVSEVTEPFACSLLGMSPAWLALARAKFRAAVHVWRECLTTDRWPAYPERICYVEPPGWAEAQWITRAQEVVDDGRPLEEQLFERGIIP